MKKIILTALFVATLFSCEEDRVTYDGATFVAFKTVNPSNLSVSENAGTYNLNVGIGKPLANDLTINISSSDDTAIAGTHYSIPSAVTIPAGQMYVNVPIQIIDDTNLNSTRKFTVELSSTSSSDIVIGISDEGSYKKDISIINDDCPTKFTYWFGALDCEDVGYGSTPGTGAGNDTGDCDILVVNNNLPGATPVANMNTTYIINFTPTNSDGTEGIVQVSPTFVRTQVSGGITYDAKYDATGTYSTVTGEITLNYRYRAYSQTTGAGVGNFWTGTNVITLQ